MPSSYTRFRAVRIDSFTHGYLRDAARNGVVAIGSEYKLDDINGSGKDAFLDCITRELHRGVSGLGVNIAQFGPIGAPRPPQSLPDALVSVVATGFSTP